MADLDKVIENIEGGILMARATDTKLVHMTVEHVEEVLELLKSQKAEITEKDETIAELERCSVAQIADLQAEVERLKAENRRLRKENKDIQKSADEMCFQLYG